MASFRSTLPSSAVAGAFTLLAALTVAPFTSADEPSGEGSTVTINGTSVRVRWSDGDSFRFLEGEYDGHGVRLMGYNALESYGPVHRWGEWTGAELGEVSAQSTAFARAGSWTCTTTGETDHYDRVLVACEDLTVAMVGSGFGHLFIFEDSASAEAVAAQAAAQAAGLGMWAKGVPGAGLLTSLHSIDEEEGQTSTYNRVADTATGQTVQVTHSETYSVCQEVCHGEVGSGGSCMTYVPFSQRYGGERAACLR